MLVVPGILSTCDPTNRAENKKGSGETLLNLSFLLVCLFIK